MLKTLFDEADKYFARKRHRQIRSKIVSMLGCIVVFCTTYALILPAITLEKETCDLEEHVHTDECYCETIQDTFKIHERADASKDESGGAECVTSDFVLHLHDDNCFNKDGELICSLDELEEHVHTDECYGYERGELICETEESEEHEHGDECFNEDGELVCENEENEGHVHSDECYEQVEVLICAMEEVLPHEHSDECYDGDELICGRIEIMEHQHSSDCIHIELVCGVEEHVHTEECAEGSDAKEETSAAESEREATEPMTDEETTELSSDEDEAAKRTANAESEPTEKLAEKSERGQAVEKMTNPTEQSEESADRQTDDNDRVANVIKLIDGLPTDEEIQALYSDFEEDDAAYEDIEDLNNHIRYVYSFYEDLGEELQNKVRNADRIVELGQILRVQTYAEDSEVTVYNINRYAIAEKTILVHGGTVRAKLGEGMSFKFWHAYVIEENSNGKLYVADINRDDVDKRDFKATSANGFVLLVYYPNDLFESVLEVGDIVSVDFDYKSVSSGSNGAGYGVVRNWEATGKEQQDNTNELHIVQSANTSDIVTINLYNYGTKINDMWANDSKYPGFQQQLGTNEWNWWSAWNLNFGDNIVSEIEMGAASVTNQGGAINKTNQDGSGINKPIGDALYPTLIDGYPALNDGTSLKYLFSDNPATTTTKQNTNNVNGLFQYDEERTEYYYDSYKNHAQFNADTDTFTLYEELVTPNFMMYPFGNFMPFNDIVYETIHSSKIEKDNAEKYFRKIAETAAEKAQNSTGKTKEAYEALANVLTGLISGANQHFGAKNWNAAMLTEFCLNGVGHLPSAPFANGNNESLNGLYTIEYDEPKDFFFGMDVSMEFLQPYNGITGKNGDVPMKFEFMGDDDVWVYIDGILFLDLSGIHRAVGGNIDFVNGTVNYIQFDTATGDLKPEPYKTLTFKEVLMNAGKSEAEAMAMLNDNGTFKDYTKHQFKFYYMERGAGSSTCKINFNFPILQDNIVAVTKKLDVDEEDLPGVLGNPDFRFQLLRQDGKTPFVGEDVIYDIYDGTDFKIDEIGNNVNQKIGEGVTGKNGVFTLKANQTAVFRINEDAGIYFVRELLDPKLYGQYSEIQVDGSSQTTQLNVTVDDDTFVGVDSPRKNVRDGHTEFVYTNVLSFEKLGKLKISKNIERYAAARASPMFKMLVKLDDIKLEKGAEYTVNGETRTVEEEGYIFLEDGETAVISGITAGTRFEVTETEESKKGYTVSYSVDGVASGDGAAAGTSAMGKDENGNDVGGISHVVVTNQERGVSAMIPAKKTISNPDGKEHVYYFTAVQVNSDGIELEGGTVDETEVRVKDEETFFIEIPYLIRYADSLAEVTTFYYKITEAVGDETKAVFDKTVYMAQIKVTKADGGLEAEVIKLVRLTDGKEEAVKTAEFTNELLYDMTIEKRVTGTETDKAFSFEIEINEDGTPLDGIYEAVKVVMTDTGETGMPGTLEFKNGKALITLKNGESLTIKSLHYGAEWTVTETGTDGYIVSCQIGEGESATTNTAHGTVDGQRIIFVNRYGEQLPETGGHGTMLYIFSGGFLMIFALMYYIIRKRRGAM